MNTKKHSLSGLLRSVRLSGQRFPRPITIIQAGAIARAAVYLIVLLTLAAAVPPAFAYFNFNRVGSSATGEGACAMAISEETGALYFVQTDNTVHQILNGQTALIDANTSGATFDGDGYLTGGVYTIELAAAGNNVYELRSDGSVWKYGGSANVWWLLDRNSDTAKIEATGGDLYQLHLVDSSDWLYTGPATAPPSSIFFWTQIDNQPQHV